MEFYNGLVSFRVKHHNRYLGVDDYDGRVRAHHELTEREVFSENPVW